MTDYEPSLLTKIIMSVVMAVVGPALVVGGVALGTAWFVPDKPEVIIECDDDYTYIKTQDDTFVNDHGDVCVESKRETWQTVSASWDWWFPLDMVVTFLVIVAAVVLAIGGLVLLVGGIGALWEKPKPNRYV